MELVTLSELARIITAETGEPFSRQACHKAAGQGLFPVVEKDGKKYADLESDAVKIYITQGNRQREQAIKKDDPVKLQNKKPVKTKSTSKLKFKTVSKTAGPSDFMSLDPYEIKQRAQIADMRKKEAQAQIIEKNYLPREFVEDGLFRYLTRLNTTIERAASVYISEVGNKILEAGEIRPEHIEKFISLVLESIDETKKRVIKEIEKYEPRV